MLQISLGHSELLRLIIAVGTFVFLIDILYWVIRFACDYVKTKALVALALFFLMFAIATRQAWSVYISALPVISFDAWVDWTVFNLYLRIATVILAIFSTRFLRYAFKKERDVNGEANGC